MGNKSSKNKHNLKESFVNHENNEDLEIVINKCGQILKEKAKISLGKNKNLYRNIRVALDKKKFSEEKDNNLFHHIKYITWKHYFLNFLQKYDNQLSWVSSLKKDFLNENFINEKKYVTLFFWEEMSLKINTFSYKNREKGEISYDLNQSFNTNNLDKYSNFKIDSTEEYKIYRAKVKIYTGIFKTQIAQIEHPINIIIELFIIHFNEFSNVKIEEIEKLDNEMGKFKICEELITQIKKFILKVKTCLKLMYCKTISIYYFKEERDELIHLISNLLFKNKDFYRNVYRITQISTESTSLIFQGKLQELKYIFPQDLGINQKFCLNDATLNYQKALFENRKRNFENNFTERNLDEQGVLSDLESLSPIKKIKKKIEDFKTLSSNISFNESVISANKLDSSEMSLNTQKIINDNRGGSSDASEEILIENRNTRLFLYEKAVQRLRSIKNYQAPIDKLLLVSNLTGDVNECVNEFWKDEKIRDSLLNIDADELMSIFIYIVIKSQLKNLLVHLKMIKDFTTDLVRSSNIGYNFLTLEGAVTFIMNLRSDSKLHVKNDIIKNS